jgi:carbon-monoxide dehydrogenase medium subunit
VIPAEFAYERATSLEDALARLQERGADAKVIAGGQSLLPLMKLRLARPERLIDIGRLEELRGIRDRPDGGLSIGALTTWAALLDDPRVMANGALADAIPSIADVQIRNLGTIGGSLAHADPSADILAPALALDLAVVLVSSRGLRTVAVRELVTGPFSTVIEPDELLTEIHVPAATGLRSAYRFVAQPASGFPLAGVAVIVGRAGDTRQVTHCGIGVTGVGDIPYRATEVEAAVLAGAAPADAAALVVGDRRVASDIHADREYRSAMAVAMTRRALEAVTAAAAPVL